MYCRLQYTLADEILGGWSAAGGKAPCFVFPTDLSGGITRP